MTRIKLLFVTIFAFCIYGNCNAKPLNILVTINPIYSLVKNVTGDLNNVQLLIDKNMCPHDYQLRPSDVRKINSANLFITIGDEFEFFLFNYVKKAKIKTDTVKLIDAPSLTLLPVVKNNSSDEHEHEHEHEQMSHGHHGHHHHHEHHEHEQSDTDLHFWSSVKNAKVIVQFIATSLSKRDPSNEKIYLSNAKATIEKLSKLELQMKKKLEPVRKKKFIVLDNEYQYLVNEYHLSNVGKVIVDHEMGFSVKKLRKIKKIVQDTNAKCILIESHTSPTLVKKIAKLTGAKVAYVDIEWGKDSNDIGNKNVYFTMMTRAADNISACLLGDD